MLEYPKTSYEQSGGLHNEIFTKIIGKTRWNCIRNEVREELKVVSLKVKMEEIKPRWFRHVSEDPKSKVVHGTDS